MSQIAEFSSAHNFDERAVRNLIDFMVERTGDFINEENAVDVLQAYIPEFMRVQENLAVQAHTHMSQFAPLIADLIRSEERGA